jgi:hypothetical protein
MWLSWRNPFLTYSIVILPLFDVSIALKASLNDLKSISEVKLLTKNFNVSSCIYFKALKFLSFFTTDSFTEIGVSNY